MPTNVRTFNAQIKDFSERLIPAEVVALTKKVSLELLARITEKNPVITNRSRGNWQTDIEQSNEDEIPMLADPVSAGAVKLQALKPFQTVIIYNNVPYIVFLEEGSSQQAPSGMVAVSLAELSVIFP